MNALQRIFAILLIASAWPMAAHAQEGLPDGTCIPDSQLFAGNNKWWYPGEPLEWAAEGLIDSLLDLEQDYFSIWVQSPRKQGYLKEVVYIRFDDDNEVLLVRGDCRYISYTPRTRTNHSTSIVVGHTHGAHIFMKDGKLTFQNGRANWLEHSQRIWHSRSSGQMEIHRVEPPPFQAEFCTPFSSDSGIFFLELQNQDELTGVPAHFIHFDNSVWSKVGMLNPAFSKSMDPVHFKLRDYTLFLSESSIILRRHKDGFATSIPSEVRSWVQMKNKSSTPVNGRIIMHKGNSIKFIYENESRTIDADSLSRSAQWLPFLVPSPVEPAYPGLQMPWGWMMAFLLLLSTTILAFRLHGQTHGSSEKSIRGSDTSLNGPMSAIWLVLSPLEGQALSSERLDDLLGLGAVESPETRRSRRSQLVKLINTESQARFGKDLIVRDRHPSDRRVMVYRIEHLSH